MKRGKFIEKSGMIAIGICAFGKISWRKDHYIGDTPTTTDVLGPFYRPGAPIRTNINPKNYTGKPFGLSGKIFKSDGITPFENCRIEIWQCDENKLYDNISDEYKYRGMQITGRDGEYHFITTHPVPYPTTEDPNRWRPAHIHMLVSGEGQQDLITQIYLKGDPYLEKDNASSSPLAIKRILPITKDTHDRESLVFDIAMAKELKPDANVFEKLSGYYRMNDKSLMEFYKKDDLLILKWGGQIREGLSYKGNNEFAGGVNDKTTATFELLPNNEVRVKVNYFRATYNENIVFEGTKAFKYKN